MFDILAFHPATAAIVPIPTTKDPSEASDVCGSEEKLIRVYPF
jgi:hypothetical protein